MKLKRTIKAMGLLLLSFSAAQAFAKDAEKPKVIDLNQIDLEQVEDSWDNTSPNPPVNADHGPKIRDIVEPTSEYTYASFGKPDPFAIPDFVKALETSEADEEAAGGGGESAGGIGPSGKEIAIQNPLQAYPIEALTVKGVWQLASGEMRAVILTPKNEGIVIRDGDPISSGKVLHIDKDFITVRLYRLRKDGVREYEDKRISFGKDLPVAMGSIKLEPGKEAQFPGMEAPADAAAAAKEIAPFPPAPKGAVGTAAPSAQPKPATANPLASPVAPPAAAAGNPPGWPYNVTPPAVAAPTSGRPGASVK